MPTDYQPTERQHGQAKNYLLEWYESELTYIRDFKEWKSKSILDWEYQNSFGNALYYFMVPLWIRHERARNLMTLTFEWVNGPSPDDIDQFGESLKELRDVRETALASKILFLSNPQDLTPISDSVRRAVDLEAEIYKEYQPRFVKFRQDHYKEIQSNLADIELRLVQTENKFKDAIENLESVRINRYTDQLLRGIGRDLLHRPGVSLFERRPQPDDEFNHNYVDPGRITQLQAIKSSKYDLTKLIRLCEELNICDEKDCFLAVPMIVRAITDHVAPIFGFKSLYEIKENYHEGDRNFDAFRGSIRSLWYSLRNIANADLHTQIRDRETLPNRVQVNFTHDLDVMLGEVGRVLKR